MIVILDCGIGNLKSVARMVTKAGGDVIISCDADHIASAKAIVFPGVGSFDNGISRLKKLEIFSLIEERVLGDRVAFLGICLGMQLLFESSEEGSLPGLGWLPGRVTNFDFNDLPQRSLKVPHMGWNLVQAGGANDLLNSNEELRFYFVHSFHANHVDPDHVMGVSRYGYEFVSAVARNNIYGVQFHPEKSHRFGLSFFEKFLARIEC